ncbi:hypothetical protein Aple_026880 [Acrocarpospora pleiomorpha]|uniref:Uncharacterized protein n=1 Tax=Acrocarpospora pleiomorpha TaxID=90975 RepID=A0A5M3XGA2_9ACTN|nr:hypothetical protein Aple_026880 [Acrocarpospora pleiomorpha]
MANEGNVGHRAATCEVAWSVGEVSRGFSHGANAQVAGGEGRYADSVELVVQEVQVEGEVVGDRDTTAEEPGEGSGYIRKCRGMADVGGGDAMNLVGSKVSFWVDESVPFTGDGSGGAEMDNSYLYDPIAP